MNHPQRLPLGGTFPYKPGEKPTITKIVKATFDWMSTKTAFSKDVSFIVVDVPLKQDAVKEILPCGFKMGSWNNPKIYIVNWGQTKFSHNSYNETFLAIPIITPWGTKGATCPWIVVDQDQALISGRNFLACPKKLAEISVQEKGDSVSARVTRRGVPVISIEAQKKELEKDPEFLMGMRVYEPGGLAQMFFLNFVWTYNFKEIILESYTAEGSLVLEDSLYDPIKSLIADFRNPLPMRIAKVDMTGFTIPLPVWFAGARWFANTYDLRFA